MNHQGKLAPHLGFGNLMSKEYHNPKANYCLRNCMNTIFRSQWYKKHTTADESQLSSRGQINGYDIIAYANHRSYGIATYVRHGILNVEKVRSSIDENDVHIVVVKVCNIHITNVYTNHQANCGSKMSSHVSNIHPSMLVTSIVTTQAGVIRRMIVTVQVLIDGMKETISVYCLTQKTEGLFIQLEGNKTTIPTWHSLVWTINTNHWYRSDQFSEIFHTHNTDQYS